LPQSSTPDTTANEEPRYISSGMSQASKSSQSTQSSQSIQSTQSKQSLRTEEGDLTSGALSDSTDYMVTPKESQKSVNKESEETRTEESAPQEKNVVDGYLKVNTSKTDE
jgi:hypothetical protein